MLPFRRFAFGNFGIFRDSRHPQSSFFGNDVSSTRQPQVLCEQLVALALQLFDGLDAPGFRRVALFDLTTVILMRPLAIQFRVLCLSLFFLRLCLCLRLCLFAVVATTAAKQAAGAKRKHAGNDEVEAVAVARDWDLRVLAFTAFRPTGLAVLVVALVFAGCAG